MRGVNKARGFILQASYRVENRPDGARVPVIHIYGRLEDGGTFLVRDDRQRPHFYVRAADAQRARTLRMPPAQPIDSRTFAGEQVARIEVEVPSDVPALRDRLHAAGIDTFEADVRFAVRYLIERGIKGGCEIEGPATAGQGVTWIFDNPVLRPADVTVAPRVLSFDIETDSKGERLLAISMYAPGLDEVLIVDSSERPMPEKATRCVNEYAALDAFCERVRELDIDVLTGWNTIDFDLTVLQKIALRLRHPLELGRDSAPMRLRKPEGYFGSGQASISGRARAGRHRPAARRIHPHGRLLARRRGARSAGRRQGSRGRRARPHRRDRAQLSPRPARLRAVRTHRCATRVPDRREARTSCSSRSRAAS